jgi:hypothetical protein
MNIALPTIRNWVLALAGLASGGLAAVLLH